MENYSSEIELSGQKLFRQNLCMSIDSISCVNVCKCTYKCKILLAKGSSVSKVCYDMWSSLALWAQYNSPKCIPAGSFCPYLRFALTSVALACEQPSPHARWFHKAFVSFRLCSHLPLNMWMAPTLMLNCIMQLWWPYDSWIHLTFVFCRLCLPSPPWLSPGQPTRLLPLLPLYMELSPMEPWLPLGRPTKMIQIQIQIKIQIQTLVYEALPDGALAAPGYVKKTKYKYKDKYKNKRNTN